MPISVAVAAAGAKSAPAQPAVAVPEAAPGSDGIEQNAAEVSRRELLALASTRFAPAAHEAVTRFAATLTVGQEVPKPRLAGVGAVGHFTATLSGRLLSWKLTFSRLSAAATAAALHVGARGETGPGFAHLCGPCRSGVRGVRVLTQTQVAQMRAGVTYVNVGTSSNPRGEVRGQIRRQVTAVYPPPPPPTGGGHFSHVSHASHASHASHSSHSSHVSSS